MKRKTASHPNHKKVLEIVVWITCLMIIVWAFLDFRDQFKENNAFEAAKKELIEELEYNYYAMVQGELLYWRPFYNRISSDQGYPPYSISKRGFNKEFGLGFNYTSFRVYTPKNATWNAFKTAGFVNQLDFNTIKYIEEYYTEQEIFNKRMEDFIKVPYELARNNKNPAVLNEYHKTAGSFYHNIFLINISKNNHLFLIESALENLGEDLNKNMTELRELYTESANAEVSK
ncbi:hypothetical protein [Spongiivirga citrea]|uniref:Uncharacterized protein n=1 Tax=Spongiivirga citrea TaxID=1481457 RepID=A0A6M0CLZ1_9FLAO|nr:hypothetical protein [Spongiivirga citrea]NER17044.1 hypothetical protein [Spongiivirga citrea]